MNFLIRRALGADHNYGNKPKTGEKMRRTKAKKTSKTRILPVSPLEGVAVIIKGMNKLEAATIGELQSALLGTVEYLIDTTMECPNRETRSACAMEIITRALDKNAGSLGLAEIVNPLERMNPASDAIN